MWDALYGVHVNYQHAPTFTLYTIKNPLGKGHEANKNVGGRNDLKTKWYIKKQPPW